MWRALSGALAVKHALRAKGITLDTTCLRCGHDAETICHVLFHCDVSKDVWIQSGFPLPPGGFSINSVWLNFYHLMTMSKKPSLDGSVKLSFPWLLWHIWKARNAFCYEKIQYDSSLILSKALEEASIWLNLQLLPSETTALGSPPRHQWHKPPVGFVKCNVASSWIDPVQNHGAAWIVRESHGIPVFHSRRAFAPINSKISAELSTLKWSVEALHDLRVKKVCLELSSQDTWNAINSPSLFPSLAVDISRILRSLHNFDQCQMLLIPAEANSIAEMIALSVTKDRRYQSYIAQGGPHWLSSTIRSEAGQPLPS